MSAIAAFVRDRRGGPAAEFALVLPLVLLFLFGIIDVGRFAWEINRAEKATQTGARWAAATAMVPSGLAAYSFAVSGGVPAGTPVGTASFAQIECSQPQSTVTCTCKGGPCAFGTAADATAFGALVDRMNDIKPNITANNVIVEYSNSGLGFAGDPNGPDVAPLISVRLQNMQFVPLTLMLFGGAIALPDFSYSLTMEDGQGAWSN